jgi:hypothetical protein
MTNAPPVAQTVNDLVRQVAGNLQTFSGAYAYSAAGVAKTAAFLSTSTPDYMKLPLLLDHSTTTQWLVIYGTQVVVLTRPMVATNRAGDHIFLASLGDALAQATPVSIPDSVIQGGVVVLLTHANHAALNLPGCATIPGQLDPPPNPDGSPSNEQPSIDRLHFDTLEPPVFGVMPIAYPLALGETPLLQDLTTPFPTTGNRSTGQHAWFTTMAYLSAHNQGASLHAHPGLFSVDDCPGTLFPRATLVARIDVAITTVDAMSPHFGNVTTVHQEAAQAALNAHAATRPAPAGTTAGQVAVGADPGFAAALTAAFTPLVNTLAAGNKASTSATTQSEREHQQDQQAVATRYQLAWGRVATVTNAVDGSKSESVVFPALSDALLAVLSPSKVAKAEAAFQESTTSHMSSMARSTVYFDGIADWDTKSFGITGVQCLRDFRFATAPPTAEKDDVKDSVSLVHLARPDNGSVFYQTRQQEGRLIARQYLVGEDKSKLKRKITDLYYGGQIATAHDLKTAIANLWTFSSWAFPSFVTDPPALWTAIGELIFLLNSPMGRIWTDQHKRLPHVFLHMFIAVQHMWGPFIALANCLEYRNAVQAGTPVAVAAYKEASAFALLQVHKINNIIHQGSLGPFEAAPSIMRIFYPEDAKSSGSKRGTVSDDSTAMSDLTNPVPRKDQQRSPNSQSTGNHNSTGTAGPGSKSDGVMRYSLRGKPPTPAEAMSHPVTGQKTYVCGNASTVGYVCPRATSECKFIHVLKSQDLKPADRAIMKKFITNHANLNFANVGTS